MTIPAATPASPPSMTPTTLHVVRHGQTELTVSRVFSGGSVPGPPLTPSGREEGARAAEALANSGAVAVVASPLVRTQETAMAIGGRLGVAVETDDSWRECEFGDWEGLTGAQIREKFPDGFTAWLGTFTVAIPGGESMEELGRRVALARDRLVSRFEDQTVIVVTHSLVLRTLVRLALDAPPAAMHKTPPAPGSISTFQAFGDGEWAIPTFGAVPRP